MTPTTCPACDSPRQRAYSFRRSRTVVTCSSCGLRFVSPLPELEVLQHDVIESTAYSELTSETTQHLRELAVDIVAQLEQRLGGAGRLLDVGCGPGVLLSVARERGWQVTGLELSADSARRCQNAGLHVMPEPLEVVNLPEGSFDAVVLEHVHSCGMRQMRSAATLPRSASHASASASSAGDSCRPRMPQPGLRRGAAKKASGGQNANDSGFSGGSTESARDLNCCATRGLLAGGGIPRVVYGRSHPSSARRSAHGRCPLRVSRAAPPPASCQPRAGTPLRASAPREDTAPQDRVGAS